MHPAVHQACGYRALPDRIGVLASALCLLHCVLLPLLLAFLPFCSFSPAADAWIEGATLLLSALAGSLALIRGYRQHRRRRILWLFGAGFLLLLLAGLPGSEAAEMTGKALGCSALIAAHWLNARRARCCPTPAPQPHTL